MRKGLVALCMLLCSIAPATAQMSLDLGLPGVRIGINLPVYPSLVRVPGYPVYYAPQVNSNYFFYDGLYWVYQGDNWYASSWYNGPWDLVSPEAVPLYVLRVPVRYYRHAPAYFRGWKSDSAPRWGEHWGSSWEQSRRGWDNWNRSSAPAPAPLPFYQKQYSGNRYPQGEQQRALQTQNYRYRPSDPVVQQRFQAQRTQSAPAPSPQVRQAPQDRNATPQQGSPQVPARATQAPQQQANPAARRESAQPVQPGVQRQQQDAPKQQQDAQKQQQGAQRQQQDAQKQQQGAQRQQQDAQRQQQQGAQRQQQDAQRQQQQAAQRQQQQQAAKPQAQERAPQAKAPAPEAKKGDQKSREKGDQREGDRNNR